MTDSELLRAALALTLVAGGVAMAYVAMMPSRSGGSFSELYLLNESGVAADYPDELAVGETATVLVGVGNSRGSPVSHAVAVTLGEREVTTFVVTVPPGETVERPVNVTATEAGTHVLRARLYRDEVVTGEPILSVRTTVTVRPADAGGTATAR